MIAVGAPELPKVHVPPELETIDYLTQSDGVQPPLPPSPPSMSQPGLKPVVTGGDSRDQTDAQQLLIQL